MKKYIPLLSILVLGAILRFYHNLDISLWHDEAFSALLIRYPWHEMFYRLGLDVHPPAYYIFLRLWDYVFGSSLLSLRSASVLFGVGVIWSAYLFTKEAFKNEKAALWAAVLIAINPFQLQYVTEARMYTMGAFFALLAGYFLVKALHSQKELAEMSSQNMPNLPEVSSLRKSVTWAYIGFTLSTIIIIYTHYYLFFTATALGLYGLIYLFFHHFSNWKKYIPLLTSFVAIILSFLPWLKVFLFQLHSVGQSYWIPAMDRWSIPATFWDMFLGFSRDVTNHTTQFWLVIITIFCVYLLYSFLKRTQDFAKWLVLLAVVAPFCGAILFALLARLKGSSSSVFLDRYFLFASVYFSIAVAVWLKEIPIKWLSLSLFGAYCLLNLAAYTSYWSDLNVLSRPGMSATSKYLQANVGANDKLFVGTSYMFFNFKYYWTVPDAAAQAPNQVDDINTGYHFFSNVRPLLFTGGRSDISQMSSVEGLALLHNEDLAASFSQGVHPGDTAWLIWTNGFYQNKPQVPLNWTQVDERSWAEVRPLHSGIRVYVDEYKVN